jgi:hypothetical protein
MVMVMLLPLWQIVVVLAMMLPLSQGVMVVAVMVMLFPPFLARGHHACRGVRGYTYTQD